MGAATAERCCGASAVLRGSYLGSFVPRFMQHNLRRSSEAAASRIDGVCERCTLFRGGCRDGSASKEVCCYERRGPRPPPMNRRRASRGVSQFRFRFRFRFLGRAKAPSGVLARLFSGPSIPRELFAHVLSFWRSARALDKDRAFDRVWGRYLPVFASTLDRSPNGVISQIISHKYTTLTSPAPASRGAARPP